ncbi:ADP-ribose pyrophosphatase, mitochondrial [Schistosoma japonicum]|nr:ADP-ribose pyrophosphatase, mitochondrial [Schistosoma japonicum]KAH8874921.1 ADP-ribose pyrophosphatase, mitochondrial [Schistosoma japonicum]
MMCRLSFYTGLVLLSYLQYDYDWKVISNTSKMASLAVNSLHVKCRNSLYPRTSDVQRFPVPDDKVNWNTPWPEYHPVAYTSPGISKKPWADPDNHDKNYAAIQFNKIDGILDRTSFTGLYGFSTDGLPLNPRGRTGITGRGVLGRWGPNHAADPIVTRWKTDKSGNRCLDSTTRRPILQFVSIRRKDSGEWAIPGGMVDAGENYTSTLKREFSEEALNSTTASPKELEEIIKRIYKGYVDDPRNTDNAWMETVAVNFHDDHGNCLALFPLTAGDDAEAVRWIDINSDLHLYANHHDFIKLIAELRNAQW